MAFVGGTEEDGEAYQGPTPHMVSTLSQNVREKLGATYCVCESGTAGPTGGNTPNRQPWYVALAVTGLSGTETDELNIRLGGDREGNVLKLAEEALKLAKSVIEKGRQQEDKQ